MKRFTVGMIQKVVEKAQVIIEAETADEAMEKALALAFDGKCEWSFVDCTDDPIEVTDVEVLP